MTAHLRKFLLFYIAALCALFTIALYYPGFLSFDGVYQLRQARYGIRDNGHPPLMAYLWRILDFVIPGPAGMLILQTILYWFSLAMICRCLKMVNWLRVVLLLTLGFFPPLFGLLGTIWKDVSMHAFLLAAVACCLIAQRTARLAFVWAAYVFLFFAAGFRHNALAAAFPLLLWNTHIAARIAGWRVWRASVLAFVILFAGVTFVNRAGVADAQLWRGTLVHDLVGISVRTNTNLLPLELSTASGLSFADLKSIYVGWHLDSLFHPEARPLFKLPPDVTAKPVILEGVDSRKIRDAWLSAISAHPSAYVAHRMELIRKLLVFEAGAPWAPYHIGVIENDLGVTYTPGVRAGVIESTLGYLAWNTYLYSVWIYLLLLLALLAVFRTDPVVFSVAFSGLLYELTNFILAASPDFRYSNWLLGACVVCVIAAAAHVSQRFSRHPADEPAR